MSEGKAGGGGRGELGGRGLPLPPRLEYDIWKEVFDSALEVFRSQLRGPEDWPRVKAVIAERIARILPKYFRTIRVIALSDLSGGECVEDLGGSFDIDLVIVVDSPAESYALSALEPVIDNALKEALIYSKDYKTFKRLTSVYERGIRHNVIEIHVNDEYAARLARASMCPPIILYSRSN